MSASGIGGRQSSPTSIHTEKATSAGLKPAPLIVSLVCLGPSLAAIIRSVPGAPVHKKRAMRAAAQAGTRYGAVDGITGRDSSGLTAAHRSRRVQGTHLLRPGYHTFPARPASYPRTAVVESGHSRASVPCAWFHQVDRNPAVELLLPLQSVPSVS
jgi:hypothetical protein